MLTATVTN